MSRQSVFLIILFFLLLFDSSSIYCQNSTENKDVSFLLHDFIYKLSNTENLGDLFADDWTLIYHEDNRCDGSTDGVVENLSSHQIDLGIKIKVKNDGEGWACEKKSHPHSILILN
jgi:hypothetical protein